jgi:mannosylglycoprotein endo-beta-mannosidase
LRSFLKGWGANLKKEARAEKDSLINQIKVLDELAYGVGLSEDEWGWRYHLEDLLVLLYQREEEYWRQRSRVKWTMQGDANTAYFHAVANGRRRKCAILSLQTPTGPISEKGAIQAHIYNFYRELMGTEDPQVLTLVHGLWDASQCVSLEENCRMAITFTDRDLDEVLAQTKTETAPGPDGLPVAFFKSFWNLVRPLILGILNDFTLGRVDISRLNFGVLSLLPKVPGADSIKLFRPIALINVIFKFISKAFAIRLAP